MRTIVMYGPRGCGKTRHGEALRKQLGCVALADEWLPGDLLVDGGLHFYQGTEPPPNLPMYVEVLPFKEPK